MLVLVYGAPSLHADIMTDGMILRRSSDGLLNEIVKPFVLDGKMQFACKEVGIVSHDVTHRSRPRQQPRFVEITVQDNALSSSKV